MPWLTFAVYVVVRALARNGRVEMLAAIFALEALLVPSLIDRFHVCYMTILVEFKEEVFLLVLEPASARQRRRGRHNAGILHLPEPC